MAKEDKKSRKKTVRRSKFVPCKSKRRSGAVVILVSVVFSPLHQRFSIMAAQNNYPAWNAASPLNLAVVTDFPRGILKTLPKFDGTSSITAYEHCRDVAWLAQLHNVTEENVVVRLLACSFKGKALDWFCTLPANSITTWAELAEVFVRHFDVIADPFSLLTQFTSIKRHEHESIFDFNLRFEKTWKRVPVHIRPSEAQADMYYMQAHH